ncbi:MAG: CDGSH iron-sulfur domain-containing protein [Thermoanaerobaculales bacterium]|jgi:CDGSH-type Zn-finger protein|nr:CDGSH iron-sulfur domain-containing protein [Thermoanaerobaculales bacterium]
MSEPKIAGTTPVVLQLEAGTYYWCACGHSENQPWCDGSHAGTGMEPVAFTVEGSSKTALCQCKHTGDQPRCDGSHSKL